ncbi:MAG: hypothetical protein D6730_19325 [Bacteroidetes bacterium]|nr:MAG: hypothetical protein D6730_19325 [Bacteroidota bacterium]
MSYTHLTHPEAEYDIRDITHFFIDDGNFTVAMNFLDAVDDTIERIINELNNNVFRAAKFDEIYGAPVIASKSRKNYAKNFSDYYIWYEINQDKRNIIIWAVDYGSRDSEARQQRVGRRRR